MVLSSEFTWSGLDAVRASTIFLGVSLAILVNFKIVLKRFNPTVKLWEYLAGNIISLTAIWVVLVLWLLFISWATDIRLPISTENEMGKVQWLIIAIPVELTFFGSTLIEVSLFARNQANQTASLKTEKLETELKFLKSQINPHFLFNSLNNIYSFVITKSDKAPDAILTLSKMLRYMLYECKQDYVSIKKEVEYLENYLYLTQLRDSTQPTIHFDFGKLDLTLKVSPMLFIPFFENAIKHGDPNAHGDWLKARLSSQEKTVDFTIENRKAPESHSKDKVGGIGLENVRRQLQLAYPGKHVLDLQEDDKTYSVHLSIKTS